MLDLDEFVSGSRKIAVVGMGYVGLPLCVGLGKLFKGVIGFDINEERIKDLLSGKDKTEAVSGNDIREASVEFTARPEKLKEAAVVIIAVPTPVNSHNMPDLKPLESASETVGKHLARGSVVVYESTVYPGVTEEICGPILERSSGLKAGRDFKLGYSPERINPGDRQHTLESITKVVAGQDMATTELLAGIYGSVVKAGVYKAADIRTAEAAKVIENIQRDLNIALVNELAIIFHHLGIDTARVLEAAATKWNFLPFRPGLVGGHCIGVDPYYLTFKAQEVGYHPEVILAGRRINDQMGRYIAGQTVKEMIKAGTVVKGSKVLIMGFTFKENVKDVRNTRVIDIHRELEEYGVQCFVFDSEADKKEVKAEYGIDLIGHPKDFGAYSAVIAAVRHEKFDEFSIEALRAICGPNPVMIDVKGMFEAASAYAAGFSGYWRL